MFYNVLRVFTDVDSDTIIAELAVQGRGINYVIYDNFDEILSPRSVTPVE